MSAKRRPGATQLARAVEAPPGDPTGAPDAVAILYGCEEPPPFPEGNVFPIEWRTETPKLWDLYDKSRDPGWAPNRLPWETLKPEDFTLDQRYALAYWFALLSVFDSSGPAVFARAMIHTCETHAEDPLRKCFFSITRDEVNHEEVCQRAIQTLTPGGPLDYEPESDLGRLARNNVKWYFHNGCRYWEGFKNGVHKFPLPILFSAFLMGEVASSKRPPATPGSGFSTSRNGATIGDPRSSSSKACSLRTASHSRTFRRSASTGRPSDSTRKTSSRSSDPREPAETVD